ncbi:hypothetical protein NEOC95_000602 [Neochlamydia sp. AcF95]|nr:hypothetical protein [Neochlamydia sp. AcF95]
MFLYFCKDLLAESFRFTHDCFLNLSNRLSEILPSQFLLYFN